MSYKSIPTIALIGQTNVGKSSLFNLLIRSKINIVAREAGTTRDSIYQLAEISHNKYAWLIDTAGLKNPEDDFEITIQDQIDFAITNANLICVLIEAHKPLSHKDRLLAKKALKTSKQVILVVNKYDLNLKAKLSDFNKLGIKNIFLISATTKAGYNDFLSYLNTVASQVKIPENNNIKLALIGRPNVGKSALFNSLANKQQALVSKRAGTTRDINRQVIKFHNQGLELLDTAGIRRSGKIAVGVEKFSVMRTLNAIAESDICLLLIDANELATAVDLKIAGMVKQAGKGLIIVISKWDALEAKDQYSLNELSAKIKTKFDFVPWSVVIVTSAVTGKNVAKIFELALEIQDRRQQKITTSKLNQTLQIAINTHPPAGLKNSHPKLNYITQISNNPPTFQCFGSYTNLLHWSYKRYLERKLRETFDYQGTAIILSFKEKH